MGHHVEVIRALRAAAGGVLAIAGLAGVTFGAVVLARQGLDRAEKWVSLIEVPASLVIGVVGLVLAFRALRGGSETTSTARRTGDAFAAGPGSRAVTGVTGPPGTGGVADHTGAARAFDGGSASTGIDGAGDD